MNAGRARWGLVGLTVTMAALLGSAVGCPRGDAGESAGPGLSRPRAASKSLPPSQRWSLARSQLAAPAQAPAYRWKPVRIGGGGFVTGLAIHGSVPDLVYARTDVGGAYRWNESTRSWAQLVTAERMPPEIVGAADGDLGGGMRRTHAYQVESLGLDPSDPGVLFLALGDDLGRDGWIVKSRDGGGTFRLLRLSVPMGGNQAHRTVGERFAVDPRDGRIVYFGSRKSGLLRSVDGGERWSIVEGVPVGERIGGADVGVAIVKFDPSADGASAKRTSRIHASVAGAGLFTSEDAGATWKRAHAGFAVDLEISGGVLYAAMRGAGVFRFSAGLFVDVTPHGDKTIEDLAVDAKDPRRVFAASEGLRRLYRSTDGGRSWAVLRSGSGEGRGAFRSPDIPWVESSSVRDWLSVGELALDPHRPSRLWLAEGMGVWRSDDARGDSEAPSFQNVSRGIEETVATGAAAAKGTLVVTVWDRIGFQFGDLDAPPKSQLGLSGAFSNGSSVDATAEGVFAVVSSDIRFCCGDGNYSGHSRDSGRTWQSFGSIRGGKNSPQILKFGEAVLSPPEPSNLVWAPRLNEARLYYSLDWGGVWRPASIEGFKNASAPFLTTKRILAADPVARGRFYAYGWEPGRVYVSSNGGAHWEGATGALPSGVWHGQLRAVPGRRNHLFFCTGPDYRAPRGDRGLYRSTDGGGAFEAIEGIHECWSFGFGRAMAPGGPPTLFMYGVYGDAWGVYRSPDLGASWSFCGDYPLGLFGEVATVTGDPERAGRVYLGYRGTGFVYGDELARP